MSLHPSQTCEQWLVPHKLSDGFLGQNPSLSTLGPYSLKSGPCPYQGAHEAEASNAAKDTENKTNFILCTGFLSFSVAQEAILERK